MSDLPYSDPSNPALPSPLFSDLTAVRGDHMRANNAAIFANFDFLIDLLNGFFTDSDQLTVDEILEKTSGVGVTIDGVLCKDGVITGDVTGDVTGNADTATHSDHTHSIVETGTGAGTIRKKIIEIGDWNMDSTENVVLSHGITFDKIRSVNVLIRYDSNGAIYSLIAGDGSDSDVAGWILWDTTTIQLHRVASGFFDSTNFDSTSYNRGWITIEYVD